MQRSMFNAKQGVTQISNGTDVVRGAAWKQRACNWEALWKARY